VLSAVLVLVWPVISFDDEITVPTTVVTTVEASVSDWLVSFSVTVVVELSNDVPPAEPRIVFPVSVPELLSTPVSTWVTVSVAFVSTSEFVNVSLLPKSVSVKAPVMSLPVRDVDPVV